MTHVLQTIERNEVQIQLKQAEITQAIKQYISKQGITLADKHVAITFTAGRKESGLMADIVIEELGELPFLDEVVEPIKNVLTLVQSTDPVPTPEVAAEPLPEVGEDPAPKTTTASLFS